jgi:hypothetical protein
MAQLASNNSFKPNLLRYTKAMAEKACHDFGSTTQVGLTQVLGLTLRHLMKLVLLTMLICLAGCASAPPERPDFICDPELDDTARVQDGLPRHHAC